MRSRDSQNRPLLDLEVLPLRPWRCEFRSSLRDALERFTETTAARPCGPCPGMYPSDVLHLILVSFYPCSCFCDLFCTCCSLHPSRFPLPCFSSNCQAGHTPLRALGVTRRRRLSSISSNVVDLEYQPIPVDLWPCPPVPWAWWRRRWWSYS